VVVYRVEVFHVRLDPTEGRPYPTRLPVHFKRKSGQIVLDQIRTVDKSRLVKRLGKIDEDTRTHVLALLAELFAP